ncbi:thiamine pyrophosphate-dependent dehydrogenase E1 component subunit alpha [Colwellia sp. E150_009]
MLPTNSQRIWMYRNMLISRYMEERIEAIYMEGKKPVFNMANGPIPGEMHLSNGQEPCAVGVCAHLNAEDIITATHRPHHIAVAKGVNLDKMMAEIFGKKTGLSGGRGGHMHLFDSDVNFSCSGIIAQGMGPAVGAALSRKMQNKSGIAISYIGEGAANQGAFHESLNLASVWNLPVIFIIEDNDWGISVAKSASTSVTKNSDRAAAYNMPGIHIEHNCPDKIFSATKEAIDRARNGGGPTLIEIQTSRLAGHFMGDAEAYRPEGEKEQLIQEDPLPTYRQKLLSENIITYDEDLSLVQETQQLIEKAITFARESEYPEPEEAMLHVFA